MKFINLKKRVLTCHFSIPNIRTFFSKSNKKPELPTYKMRALLKVHDLMEEIAEQQEVSNEIAAAISNPVGLQSDIDDDELMKELEEMEEVNKKNPTLIHVKIEKKLEIN